MNSSSEGGGHRSQNLAISSDGSSSSTDMVGVEKIPLDQIPANCRTSSPRAHRNRKNFLLREKQRLLEQGKLVPKGQCKFLSDGAVLKWERINVNSGFVDAARGTRPRNPSSSLSDLGIQALPVSTGPPVSHTALDNALPSIEALRSSSASCHGSDSEMDQLVSSEDESQEMARVTQDTKSASGSYFAPIIISDSESEDSAPAASPQGYRHQRHPIEHVTTNKREEEEAAQTQPRKGPISPSPSIISINSSPGPDTQPESIILQETKHVSVPKAAYPRGRRVLIQDGYLVTVSMRGDLQFFNKHRREREKALSTPWDPDKGEQRVEDACVVDGLGVVGFSKGPQQVLLVQGTERIPLTATPHRLGGISSLCPVKKFSEGIRFLTGGHDHTVQLWTVSTEAYRTKIAALSIRHSSLVHALVYSHTREHVITASNVKAVLFDLAQGKEIHRGNASNVIYRMHVHPDQPDILATEVKHLDRQINIHDLRAGFFHRGPAIEMGYRDQASAPGTRYQCGDFKASQFVRGYHDGSVRLFDIRNPKSIADTALTRREHGAAHSIFWNGSTVLAFGGTTLSFLDFHYKYS